LNVKVRSDPSLYPVVNILVKLKTIVYFFELMSKELILDGSEIHECVLQLNRNIFVFGIDI